MRRRIGWLGTGLAVLIGLVLYDVQAQHSLLLMAAGDVAARLRPSAGDPAAVGDGQVWYDTSAGKLMGRQGGSSIELGGSGGGGARTLGGSGEAVRCQAAVCGAGFNLPTANAPTAVIDGTDNYQGYLQFAQGATQTIMQRVKLPKKIGSIGTDWTGTLNVWFDGFSASQTAVTISTYLSCTHGALSNPTYGTAQTLSFTPAAASAVTSSVKALDVTNANGTCAAGDFAYIKVSIPATAGAGNDFKLVSLPITE